MDICCRISKTTARDFARELIAEAEELPTIYAARKIAEQYAARGGYVSPEYLLRVWEDELRGGSEE